MELIVAVRLDSTSTSSAPSHALLFSTADTLAAASAGTWLQSEPDTSLSCSHSPSDTHPRCTFVISSVDLPCGHRSLNVPCFLAQNPEEVVCKVKIEKLLPCGTPGGEPSVLHALMHILFSQVIAGASIALSHRRRTNARRCAAPRSTAFTKCAPVAARTAPTSGREATNSATSRTLTERCDSADTSAVCPAL